MITRVTDPKGWNEEVLRLGGGFLQSWEWGEVQRALGFDVLRFRSGSGLAQVLRRPLPLGKSYWYCPRGPLGELDLRELARESGIAKGSFLRFEPLEAPSKQKLTAVKKCLPVQPERTIIVDLRNDEATLLARMREKTRYNVRLAERKGVRVYRATTVDIDAFLELMRETAGRDGFRAHPAGHYRTTLEMLAGEMAPGPRPTASLWFAEHDGRILAANLMISFGDTVTYLHGASSRLRREVMAPYLLHWTIMREAKAHGLGNYDFWGVAPEDAGPKHPWAGISRFKRGFGGEEVEYPGTFDLPLDRFWYTLYSLARRARP
jgi:lipid II:glycine glycyltransferase (peptidoglycan interpeptide bridge formation enzyme)